ncbi:type VII toxin-antitoxin system MntA family adenylyltransferase antitoxin [Caldicellulosiruptor acetigenus]|uniref:type VII toxin-antitoxin system MntA family adenylyltransferase antitoxin n=1 Tax=Caldicellulosiruptor acetigenus TaxID=301953 RepID=UPI001E39FAB3|nr:nucleotidyltransferase domain-containing protein [Caldicellulosiruptor acetigenus]WAM36155.1 nucleotidyltransferase domain-containing protein [Caldicellulosiruptor acetigenus]
MYELDYLEILRSFFEKQDDVLMAFLFGSVAKNISIKESDVDIAVYFTKYEQKRVFKLWNELEDLLKKNVDLIVLNKANCDIAWEAIKGKKILIRDNQFFINYFLEVSQEAEDFREDLLEIFKIRQERRNKSA